MKKAKDYLFFEKSFFSFLDFRIWLIEQNKIDLKEYVFRGVSRAETYKLIPSALRKGEDDVICILKSHPDYYPTGFDRQDVIREIVTSEFTVLSQFAQEANRQGLYIPCTSKLLTDSYLRKYHLKLDEVLEKWYPDDILDLAALAQHYEIKTRMLDWSYDIFVAAFFALEDLVCDIMNKCQTNEPYAIWGVNPNAFEELYGDQFSSCPIKFFVPNYWGNNNVRSQKGLLSYSEITDYQNAKLGHYIEKSIDQELLDYLDTINTKHQRIENDATVLFKITISSKNAQNDFRSLCDMGYNAASIYSGLIGVKKKLDEDKWIK